LSSHLFLKYNFKARKFYVSFTIKSNKRQLFKNAEFCSHLAEFFSIICRQPGLGPGNSGDDGEVSDEEQGAATGLLPLTDGNVQSGKFFQNFRYFSAIFSLFV
jgi:hypothetical protein